MTKASSLRFGRLEFVDGASVLKGHHTRRFEARPDRSPPARKFRFFPCGRSFDGIQYVRGTSSMNLTLLAARATQGVFQVNGWSELDTDVLYGAFRVRSARSRRENGAFFPLAITTAGQS